MVMIITMLIINPINFSLVFFMMVINGKISESEGKKIEEKNREPLKI